MICPNEKCHYSGYSNTGICPKCGEKMVPNHLLNVIAHHKKSPEQLIKHYTIQIVSRIIESTIACSITYGILWLAVFLYNDAAREVKEFDVIDFDSNLMLNIKLAVFGLIILYIFLTRFKKP